MAVVELEKIEVSIPKKILFSMKESKNNIGIEMMKYYALKMYELSKLSSSNCAKLLNISRIEFLKLASNNKITVFDERADGLTRDIANA